MTAAVKRQILPSVPRHWTLVRAFRMLGVSVLTPSPHRSYEPARRRRIHHEDRIPGGVDYIYETGREAYRLAAKRYHPDHGGTTEAMQAVNQAWDFIERRYGPGRAALLAGPRW